MTDRKTSSSVGGLTEMLSIWTEFFESDTIILTSISWASVELILIVPSAGVSMTEPLAIGRMICMTDCVVESFNFISIALTPPYFCFRPAGVSVAIILPLLIIAISSHKYSASFLIGVGT